MDIVLHKDRPPKRSHRKKYLFQLMLARSDIDAARSACKVMLETVDGMGHDLYYPLYTAIVICYARPFTDNKPQGPLPKRWQKFDNEEYKNIHTTLIKARHELIAHSDMSVRKAMIVPPGAVIGKLGEKELKSARIGTQTNFYAFSVNCFSSVYDLAKNLGNSINAEIDEIVYELYGDMELPNRSFILRIDEGF